MVGREDSAVNDPGDRQSPPQLPRQLRAVHLRDAARTTLDWLFWAEPIHPALTGLAGWAWKRIDVGDSANMSGAA